MPYGSVNADLMTTSDGVSSSGLYGFKNRIINGAMVIDQRNAGASTSNAAATPTYVVDRWKYYGTSASKFTIQQTPSATETGYATRVAAGFQSYLAFTSSASTTVGSSDLYGFAQIVEGFNTSDLAWGTANAKTVTLSFLAYSSLTGTFTGSLGNSAGNRSYPFSYSIPVANTWTQISVTIAGDTSGTWVGATNGAGIQIWFNLGSGSTNLGTAGSWASTFYYGATGSQSIIATSGATFYITGVQLEKGSTATSFDYRPYGTELQLCQRYYWRQGGSNAYQYFGLGFAYNTTNATFTINNPVPMRATPSSLDYSTIGVNDGATLTAVTSVSADLLSPIFNQINATVASGLTQYRPMRILANNSTSAYLGFNAEL
jgi:hypothetical protein